MENALQLCVRLLNQAIEYNKTSKLYDSLGYKGQAKRYAHKAEAFNESAYIATICYGISFTDLVEAVSSEVLPEDKD